MMGIGGVISSCIEQIAIPVKPVSETTVCSKCRSGLLILYVRLTVYLVFWRFDVWTSSNPVLFESERLTFGLASEIQSKNWPQHPTGGI